jgi:cell wall-associated NlpC family hydrolase
VKINKYIGIPYKLHGSDFSGCDCYGLVCLFYREEFGIELPSFTNYMDSIQSCSSALERDKVLFPNELVEKPEVGDIGTFRYFGYTNHVGVYVGRNKVLHVMRNIATVAQDLNNPIFKGRLEGWYRYAK